MTARISSGARPRATAERKAEDGARRAGRSRAVAREAVGGLVFRRLTPSRMDDFGAVLRGTWGSGCWCMYPRRTARTARSEPRLSGSYSDQNRARMSALARRRRAPGILAYLDGEPVGWVAVAPRPDLARVDASKATPPVDDVPVWVIPCITVRRRARGRGIGVALIQEAARYAFSQGAPAVEAYPRAGGVRVHDDFAFIGTEALFRKAGFRKVRGPLPGLPRTWTPRATMRLGTR